MRQLRAQTVVVAVEVIEDARRAQLPERNAGHHLRDLLERTRAARKGDERIAQLQHFRLALRKVARDDELGQLVVQKALIHKNLRLDARRPAARGEHALGERAHEPVFRPAIDERVAALADPAAERAHRVAQCGVIARVRAQIDRNVHNRFSSHVRRAAPPRFFACAFKISRPPHIQQRVRPALLIAVGAFVGHKAHVLVKADGLRVLLVDCDLPNVVMFRAVFQQPPAEPATAISAKPAGMNTRICTNIGQMLRRVTAAMPFHSTFTTPEARHTTAPATKSVLCSNRIRHLPPLVNPAALHRSTAVCAWSGPVLQNSPSF